MKIRVIDDKSRHYRYIVQTKTWWQLKWNYVEAFTDKVSAIEKAKYLNTVPDTLWTNDNVN